MKYIHTIKSNNNSPRGVIKTDNSTWRIIKGLCMVAFMVLTTIHCLTYLSGEAMAEEVGLTVNNTSTVLELNIPSTVNLNLIPTSGTAFNTANLKIGVGTNNPTGYSLSMTTGVNADTLIRTSSITDGNNNTSTPTIPSITGTFSPADFESSNSTINKWGYKLSTDTNYGAIITSTNILLKTTDAPSNATSTGDVVLNFAAKVDTTLPSGTYSTTLNFTAVSNYVPTITNISELTYMQDFATLSEGDKPFVLSSMTTGTSYTLKDSRDNKDYYIAKLADGKVWMTQNLDLNLVTDGSIVYDSTNTDIDPATPADADTGYTVTNGVAKWTPARASIDSTGYSNITTCTTQNSSGTGCDGQTNIGFASGWTNDINTLSSVDPGYRYLYPTIMASANTSWWDNGDIFYNSLNACQSAHGDCNAHYMIGNYYNFAAANATNSISDSVASVAQHTLMPNSICPKGWRLAKATSSFNDFADLLGAYGIMISFNYQGLNTIRNAPLYFVRSGIVLYSDLRRAGVESNTWSSSIGSASGGYNMGFRSIDAAANAIDSRSIGFGVRCLAR